MRQSNLFTKTRKQAPSDEVAKNAQLLIRAGYIHKEMAGVYTYLPLGLRVMNKINNIIREEMNAIGGQELIMTTLQDKGLWERTDRWSDEKIDVWFKSALKSGTEVGLGATHEEPIAQMMTDHINSYKDLPIYAYQIQTKFRNELRSKSGIMRGREFLMKDLYSFSRDEKEHDAFYEKSKQAYLNIFSRAGLGDITYETFASGGMFSQYSHEFQTVAENGEDIIYIDEKKKIAVNKEVYNDEVLADLRLKKEDLVEKKAVEVGNIFSLGTRFSEPLGLLYTDEENKKHPVVMGSYGIGPGRLMGTIVEVFSDKKGIVWPKSVSPFNVHLISLGESRAAEELYKKLESAGVEVLFDDRDISPGNKFADADLIGIPNRIVISKKTLEDDSAEIYDRGTDKTERVKVLDIDPKWFRLE